MKKRIPATQLSTPPKRKKKGVPEVAQKTVWNSKILLCLEGKDPNLLDKETLKIYQRISGTKANIMGPVPLPAQHPTHNLRDADNAPVHRRLFQILFPTETTIALLEKLSLSESIQASISVEETLNTVDG